jgi:hypothetical protein
MIIRDSFIKIHLCGKQSELLAGFEALKVIFGGGNVHLSRGFWFEDPELEDNVEVISWSEDLTLIARKFCEFAEGYQEFASQTAIFIEVKDKERHFTLEVYSGEWESKALQQIDRGLYLANYFQK